MHSTLLIMGYRSDIKTTYHSVPRFLIEIHILVKEVQLKSIKGKIHFSLGIIHRNERFLSEIYNWGKFTSLFPIRSHSEYLAQFLKVIVLVCFNKKIPIDITFLSHVLKPDKLKEEFRHRNLGYFSFFSIHRLNPEVVMNT